MQRPAPQVPGRVGKPGLASAIKPSARPAATVQPGHVAVKRELPSAAAAKETARLRVYTMAEEDDIGIQTLVGEYSEKGINHGRPFYQKANEIPGHEDVQVFVYYWDTRDGPEFSGWWFGDKVGGSQVWSRATSSGKVPPNSGWRVPWDGEVVEGLLLVEPLNAAAPPAMAMPVQAEPSPPAASAPRAAKSDAIDKRLLDERVKLATERVVAAEAETEQALANARDIASLDEELGESSVAEAESFLKTQQAAVQEEQKLLAQDLADLRASGIAAPAMADMTKLLPRLRNLQQSLAAEVTKVHGLTAKVKQKAALARQKAQAEEVAAEAEQRDARAFQDSLPEAMEIASAAEDAVETVAILAAAVSVDEETAEVGEAERKAMQDIEKSAARASQSLIEARKVVGQRLLDSKRFAPEARKVAQQEFTALQDRLTEAGKRLHPLRRFQQEFEVKLVARKALFEINQKLSGAELEVEKAFIMSSSGDGQMEKDEIKATNELLGPAQAGLSESVQLIEKRMRLLTTSGDSPDNIAAQRKELQALQQRADEARQKLEQIRTALKKHEEAIHAERLLSQAHEKIEQAEEAFLATSDAEMPFLKGLEVLPREEGLQAVAACEAAAKKCEVALETARAYLKQISAESKAKFSKEAGKRFMEELTGLRSRGEETEKKLIVFRRETGQRKTKAMLQEAVELVAEAENQMQTLAEVVKVLGSDNLEEVSVDALKSAMEQSTAAEKDATKAYNDAKTLVASKQKEAKEQTLVAELAKLGTQINNCHQELQKCRRWQKGGELLIKGKQVLSAEEEKLKKMEAVVQEMETLAAPLGSEGNDESKSKDIVQKLDVAVKTSQTALTECSRSLESALAGAVAAIRGPLNKFLSRAKASQERIEKVKVVTRVERERVAADAYVKEAEQLVEKAEAALPKLAEAELPWLKGIEVLPLKEADDAIRECEAAAKYVQEAFDKSRSFVSARVLDVHKFAEASSKPTLDRLSGLSERNNAVMQKITQFRKDTDARKRTAHIQEAAELLKIAEDEVEKSREAAAPLAAEDLSTITAEAATEICEKLASLEKAASKRMQEAVLFLAEKKKVVRGHAPHEGQLEELQGRLQKIKGSLAESKKAASQQEQRFVARKLLSEAEQMASEVETDAKKVKATAEPLLKENGSEFLAQSSVQRLAGALQELIGKGSSRDALFSKACGDGSLTEGAFKAFVAGLYDDSGSEEVAFSESQQEAMFKRLDADKSGDVSKSEFEAIFVEQFVCVHAVSMTSGVTISGTKTVAKLEVDAVVEAMGPPQFDESQKLTRLQCRLVEDKSKEGWVTMKGNQGKVYFDSFSPHAAAVRGFERLLTASLKVTSKTSNFLGTKCKELSSCQGGPLLEAKGKMDELQRRVTASKKELEELRNTVADAKQAYARCEEAEKKARKEARDRKTCNAILKEITEHVDSVEAELKQLTEVLSPLTDFKGAETEVLSMPTAALKDGEKLMETLRGKLTEARTTLANQKVAKTATKGPLGEAKQAIAKAVVKVDAAEKKATALLEAAHSAAAKVADAALLRVRQALREEAVKSERSLEAVFNGMATSSSSELVTAEVFQRHVEGLLDLKLTPEQVALVLSSHLCKEAGSISRMVFLRQMQQYFVCVKNIAITHDFAITKNKSQRMISEDEVVELLEGPQKDEKLGITRMKGRALSDNLVGWISVMGNNGSVFLKEKSKPFLHSTVDLPLEKEFRCSDEAPVRTLKAEEVIEVIEGPRKDCLEPVQRVRCRACSDGATGWMTLKNSDGIAFAEVGQKRYFTCTTAIAMTDGQNIKTCKVLRKLEPGEVVCLVEGPETDKDSGVSRFKATSSKDNLTGYVTLKGNAGTVYAEESTKLYTALRDVPLHKKFQSDGSETVRLLRKDEPIEVLEGPKEEKFDPVVRVKGRALADGAEGWVSRKERTLKSWSPLYRCAHSTVIQSTLCTKDASVIRRVEEGENLEALDGPKEDTGAGLLRIRARAEKDGVVGWITLKGNQGTIFLTARQPK
eukprot:TRINITY_DN8073_c0_g1_i4.p1 TRINITY_DN8073_c0_g1~~TRINITY_DN8073_c0_g1_i4.p1  ORF type:complete len:2013 (-),score=680.48 TRINITY_DN8073_c0_g1_i4:65-6103(-)